MNNRINDLKNSVFYALNNENQYNISDQIFNIKGFSGKEYKKFVNRLLSRDIVKNYVEIGVWHGSTVIAALNGNENKLNHWVIDNFSQFGSPKDDFLNNWNLNLKCPVNLIDSDCFKIDFDKQNMKDIDVYFYDGDHKEEDHYLALKYYYPSMANSFIYMVDDWTWTDVQYGTIRAINDLKLKIHSHISFQGYEDSNGWWNGCGIFIFEK
jgi:hypothetical protein